MSQDRITELLDKLLRGNCTPEEKQELFLLVDLMADDQELQKTLEDVWNRYDRPYHAVPADKTNLILQSILNEGRLIKMHRNRKFPVWARVVAAACILLIFGIGGYLFFFDKQVQPANIAQTEQRFKNDVAPGKYKARLTLDDGTTIVLDSAATGELTKQGTTAVINKNGQLVYDASNPSPTGGGREGASLLLYNTLTTARGETYATVLADGSKVWLNAASSIKFPVRFAGKERRVEITGEAYFEVARDKSKPFMVSLPPSGGTEGGSVQVLGTHFNVNAYDDESDIKVTLLEGSVKVSNNIDAVTIKPGQQAKVKPDSPLGVGGADLEGTVAWKNGIFDCNGLDIASIMRQAGRWYDVNVVMEPGVTQDKFAGRIPRSVTLANLLKVLELNGVKFTIEGKKITVMK